MLETPVELPMVYHPGDLVSIKFPLCFAGDDKFQDLQKVRQLREGEQKHPDIEVGTGGVVLGTVFSNNLNLLVVWVNEEQCILWDGLLELVMPFGEVEDG